MDGNNIVLEGIEKWKIKGWRYFFYLKRAAILHWEVYFVLKVGKFNTVCWL